MDFVFTVCDQAAGEICPVWPGNPVTAHWGVPDPAAVEGDETKQRRAFREAYLVLETRIKLFTSLRLEALDRLAIKRNVDEIGRLRVVPEIGAAMTSVAETGRPRARPTLGTFERYLTVWVPASGEGGPLRHPPTAGRAEHRRRALR